MEWEEDTADVADCFAETAEEHGNGVSIGAEAEAEDEVGEGQDGEDGDEEGIGREGWVEAINCLVEGAIRADGSTVVDRHFGGRRRWFDF